MIKDGFWVQFCCYSWGLFLHKLIEGMFFSHLVHEDNRWCGVGEKFELSLVTDLYKRRLTEWITALLSVDLVAH